MTDRPAAEALSFGWTAASEQAAVQHAKRLAEALATLLSLDSQVGSDRISWVDRWRASGRLIEAKKTAEALIAEIACAECADGGEEGGR